jgi:hypothetical protein
MCKKKCFRKKEARSVLKWNSKNGKQWRKETRSYECEECNCTHLTSLEEYVPLEEIASEYQESFKKFMMQE